MLENESTEKLHETIYYKYFMRGYCGYMDSEKLSFGENPEMMSLLSDIYLKAKRQGMEYERMKLDEHKACNYGVDDGWAAAKCAYAGKGEYVACGDISSEDDDETEYSSEEEDTNTTETEDSYDESDEWYEDDGMWEDETNVREEEEEIVERIIEKKPEVTREYIRGFLSGYSSYLYEHGISIRDNEQLKSCLRVSFLRALDPDDDMSDSLRTEDKTRFHPGVLDGRRCAELDIERNSISFFSDADEKSDEKEDDLLSFI